MRVQRRSGQLGVRQRRGWYRVVAVFSAVALAWAWIAGAIGGAVVAGAAKKESLTTVTVAQPLVCFCAAAIDAANTLGYLKKNGVKVKYATIGGGDPAVAAAVQSGGGQFGLTQGATFVGFVKKGLPFVAVAALGKGVDEALVMSKAAASQYNVHATENYKKVLKAVKGITVGVLGTNSASGVELRGLLKSAGLPSTWVKEVTMTQSAMEAGVAHGTIQAFYNVPPAPQIAQKESGAVVAFTSTQDPAFKNVIAVVLYTTKSYLHAHGAVVKGMVDAVLEGNNAILKKKTQNRALASMFKLVKGTQTALKEALLPTLVKNGGLSATAMKATANEALALGDITSALKGKKMKASYKVIIPKK